MSEANRLAEEFRHWVLDPARTDDALYTAELLVESGRDSWNHARKIYPAWDWEAIRAHDRERRFNPAYRYRPDPADLDAAAECWDKITYLSASGGEKRPVRDFSALRFVPHLKHLDCQVELDDLSGLTGLRALEYLTLWENSDLLTDLRPLAGLPALKSLSLFLKAPWPDLSALGHLPALHTLWVSTNLLALADVPAIPHAADVKLHADSKHQTPPRSLRALPVLPDARRIVVQAVADLTGAAERFPAAVNLDLQGSFRDLSPLADLPGVTFLRLEGERFHDLRPLARMPALRELLFVRETPFDLDPLTDAPLLREVRVERCDILRTELAALHAALTPPEEDFAVPTPRPLGPLRFFAYEPQHEEMEALHARRHAARTAAGGDYAESPTARFGSDHATRDAHSRWAETTLQRHLDLLLGAGWKTPGSYNRHGNLTFRRYRDCRRVDEILQTVRAFIAGCRYPSGWRLIFEPHGDAAEDLRATSGRQDAEDDAGDAANAEPPPGDWLVRSAERHRHDREDEREWMRQRRDQYAYLERAHRLRLRRESGLPVDPAEFSPTAPAAPAPPAAAPPVADTVEAEPDDETWDDEDDGDDDDEEGGLATAPPPEDGNALQSDLAEDLSFQVMLTENFLWVPDHMRQNAEALLNREAEDWHALPEPPEARPEPE